MHPLVKQILNHLLFYYYILEAIVLFFIPARYRSKNVSGKIVLITGAGSGIGRLMAIRFAKLGSQLVLWDLNEDGNDQTAAECQKLGARVTTYTCDVSRPDAVYSVATQVKEEVGVVDILINNAGVVTGKRLLDCPDTMIQKTMEVNSMAHFWTVKAFLPAMLSRNQGHVVTIASAAGWIGVSGAVDYCSSKFAAVGFDESLRAELWARNKTGVHTTVVCPYLIDTGMFAGCKTRFPSILPTLTPEDVADKIVEAVLTNKALLLLPGTLSIALVLKNFLPVKASMTLGSFLGSDTFMETFRGREKQM